MLRNNSIALICFYVPVLFVQFYGSVITRRSVDDWYPALEKSVLTPPGFVFGIVWTLLYLLMTIAAWRVWRVERTLRSSAQRAWALQLLTGLLWTMVFFGMRNPQWGIAVIACVVLFAVLALLRFSRVDKPAAALMVPLVAWVSFATYLNLVIVLQN